MLKKNSTAGAEVVETEDTRSLEQKEADYEAFVWANLRPNYIANYAQGMLGMTGFRILNAPTFLPAYIFQVSGSSTMVGLALALQQVGQIVSPIVGAGLIEHRRKVLPLAVLIGGLGRLMVLGIALSAWFLKGHLLVAGVLTFITLFGLFMGAQGVVFQLLISKVIPISRRGRLQAWRNTTGGIVAAGLAYLAGRYLIGGNAFGNGYATTFMLSVVLTSIGLFIFQALLREPETVTVRERIPLRQRLAEFPVLLTANRSYMYFVIMQCLTAAGRMAIPFYILYASSSIKMTGPALGALSLAYLGSDTVSNVIWGYLGDKKGFRIVTVLALGCWAAATIGLLAAHGMPLMLVAFCGLGASQAGYMMSAQTMILEFGSRTELPMRMALSSTAQGLFGAMAPLAGGLISSHFGYPTVFCISAAVLMAGLLIMVSRVPEPRLARIANLAA